MMPAQDAPEPILYYNIKSTRKFNLV